MINIKKGDVFIDPRDGEIIIVRNINNYSINHYFKFVNSQDFYPSSLGIEEFYNYIKGFVPLHPILIKLWKLDVE